MVFGRVQVIVIYDSNLFLSEALEEMSEGYKRDGGEWFFDSERLTSIDGLADIYAYIERGI